jgi:hypothetical protein
MLDFPNTSRSYDARTDRISFWGHDDTVEIAFFLEMNALARIDPKVKSSEAAALAAFDGAWERIIALAKRAYRPNERRRFYVLGPESVVA